MTQASLDLETLLSPVSATEWLDKYWERDCLWIARNRPDYFRSLFDWPDIDAILALHRSDPRDVLQLVPPPDSGLRREHRKLGSTTAGEVYQSLQQGHTIVLNFLHTLHPRCFALAQALSDEVDCKVNMNLYLTPKGEQGFPVHIDRHDVFILQIFGEKEWFVYEPVNELPLEFDRVAPALRIGGPLDEATLTLKEKRVLAAGDVLFMPRGFPHKAMATANDASLHITVSFHQSYGMEAAKLAVELLAQDETLLRKALLPGFRRRHEADALEKRLAEILAAADWPAYLRRATDLIADELVSDGIFPVDGHIDQILHLPELTPTSRVERRGSMLCRVFEDGGKSTIQFGDRNMKGPTGLRAAFEWIRDSTQPFAIADLPGPISESSKVVLARRLVKDGLLRVTG